MPAKKSTQAQDPPQTQETQTEVQTNQPSDDVNQRLARIEAAIEKMAARPLDQPAPRVPSPTVMTTRGRAKSANKSKGNKERRSVSMDPDFNRTHSDNSHSTLLNPNVTGQPSQRDTAGDVRSDVGARDSAFQRNVRPDRVTSQPGDPFISVNNTSATRQSWEPIMANPWASWSMQQDFTPRTSHEFTPTFTGYCPTLLIRSRRCRAVGSRYPDINGINIVER